MPERLLLGRRENNGVLLLDRSRGTKSFIENPVDDFEQSLALSWIEMPDIECSEKAKVFPLRMYLGLNNLCNIDCRQCYAKRQSTEPPVKLTRVEWMPILDVMDQYGLVEIRLGESGEPTIDPVLLTEFLHDSKEKGFYISLTTNGQFESKWVDTWVGLVDQPIFSIDGGREYHDWNRGRGTFDKAMQNLKLFSGRVSELRVNTIFSRRALEGLGDLIDSCAENGVNELCLLQLRPYNKGQDHWKDILTPDEWITFITKTLPEYRARYPQLRIRADYDISGLVSIDRLVDKIRQCSAGVEALGVRPCVVDGQIKLKIYGCGYLVGEGGVFVSAVLTPIEFKEGFLKLWHSDKNWEVFRGDNYQDLQCNEKCGHFGKTCFGKCVAMLRYAQIKPEFDEYLNCSFPSHNKEEIIYDSRS